MTIQQKIEAGLNELIAHGMDGGMTTFEIADLLESKIAELRKPFQNEADNAAEALPAG